MVDDEDAKRLVSEATQLGSNVEVKIVGQKSTVVRRLTLLAIMACLIASFLLVWSLFSVKAATSETITLRLAGRPTINQRGGQFIAGHRLARMPIIVSNHSDQMVVVTSCRLDINELDIIHLPREVPYYLAPMSDAEVKPGESKALMFLINHLNPVIGNTEDLPQPPPCKECDLLLGIKTLDGNVFDLSTSVWSYKNVEAEVEDEE